MFWFWGFKSLACSKSHGLQNSLWVDVCQRLHLFSVGHSDLYLQIKSENWSKCVLKSSLCTLNVRYFLFFWNACRLCTSLLPANSSYWKGVKYSFLFFLNFILMSSQTNWWEREVGESGAATAFWSHVFRSSVAQDWVVTFSNWPILHFSKCACEVHISIYFLI